MIPYSENGNRMNCFKSLGVATSLSNTPLAGGGATESGRRAQSLVSRRRRVTNRRPLVPVVHDPLLRIARATARVSLRTARFSANTAAAVKRFRFRIAG